MSNAALLKVPSASRELPLSTVSYNTQSTASTTYDVDCSAFSTSCSVTGTPSTSREPTPEPETPTLKLPLRLPRSRTQSRRLDLSSLQLDPELERIPIDFLVSRMRAMGPLLLIAATKTSVGVPNAPALPRSLPVRFPPPEQDSRHVPPPTHVLAVRSTSQEAQTLLLPAHGLMYASSCSMLCHLSRTPHLPMYDEKLSLHSLPIVQIDLPSSQAFPLLHAFIYTESSADLLASLLPRPPPSTATQEAEETPEGLAKRLADLEMKVLMEQLKLVHGLWKNASALGVCLDSLWGVLDIAWSILVGAVTIKEGRATL